MAGRADRPQGAAAVAARLEPALMLMPAPLRAALAVVPQLSRYSAVSALALALDFAIYLTLATTGMSPPAAGVIGYAAGTVLHFVLSTRFVFDRNATDKQQARLFGEYALTGLAGMGLTAIVIALATQVAGLAPLPAKVLAAAASFLLVFTLRRNFVFARLGCMRFSRRRKSTPS